MNPYIAYSAKNSDTTESNLISDFTYHQMVKFSKTTSMN